MRSIIYIIGLIVVVLAVKQVNRRCLGVHRDRMRIIWEGLGRGRPVAEPCGAMWCPAGAASALVASHRLSSDAGMVQVDQRSSSNQEGRHSTGGRDESCEVGSSCTSPTWRCSGGRPDSF